jgi:hypothetical protein
MRVALFCLLLAACGGTDPSSMNPVMTEDGGSGMGKPFDSCTQNSDCESDLCTKDSYDRLPGPVCTYQCDPANPNPKCPNGCNMKGYCKMHS